MLEVEVAVAGVGALSRALTIHSTSSATSDGTSYNRKKEKRSGGERNEYEEMIALIRSDTHSNRRCRANKDR
jgi:hypothetical protein